MDTILLLNLEWGEGLAQEHCGLVSDPSQHNIVADVGYIAVDLPI